MEMEEELNKLFIIFSHIFYSLNARKGIYCVHSRIIQIDRGIKNE